MKTKSELLSIIKGQLSMEYNCSIEDFSKHDNIITIQKNHPQRRYYTDEAFFLQMVTFGGNVVITANENMHKWLEEYTKEREGHWLFEHNNLLELEHKLNENDKRLSQTHHMFLSYKNVKPKNNGLKIKWFENEAIHQFYGSKFSSNAIAKSIIQKDRKYWQLQLMMEMILLEWLDVPRIHLYYGK